tara:strand:- start:2177 stop:2923 length:747 start_codon:yes stop_codon:yes gene_type:complete
MLVEAAAGIALLKSATSAIKEALDTGKEAAGIMKLVHQCFTAEQQIQKQKNHSVGVKDQLGMENIVQQQIDLKLAEEMMSEVRSLCNLRFGSTFWADCISARNKAIEEQKERERKARIRKQQEAKEMRQGLFTVITIIAVAGLIFGVAMVYQKAFAKAYTYQQKIHQGKIKEPKTTTCRLFYQEVKENGATRWCFYQTRIGFNRKYSTITQDSVAKCQREFKCRLNALTDSLPGEVNDTMKNLNKGFK